MMTAEKTETTVLALSWSTSRARDTYGYNICRLDDTTTGKRYSCNGGGYDMVGTVLADWLQDVHQDRLRAISDRAHALYGSDHGYTTTDDREALYGMGVNVESGAVTVDGACGQSSVERIAKAIGLRVRTLTNRKGHATGFVIEDTREVTTD